MADTRTHADPDSYVETRTAMPLRRLIGPKPHRYRNSVSTDVRRTWRRARLLAYFARMRKEAHSDPN